MGCIGGLGRTGTVLACMAILTGIAPGEAVQWVRDHYDPSAVETPEQEQWVLWFGKQVGTKRRRSELRNPLPTMTSKVNSAPGRMRRIQMGFVIR